MGDTTYIESSSSIHYTRRLSNYKVFIRTIMINRKCPLCQGSQHFQISGEMQHKIRLHTVICKQCSLVFTNPIPEKKEYQDYYLDRYAAQYGHLSPAIISSDFDTIPQFIHQKLDWIQNISPLQGKRLLEVGPGNGQFLWWARHFGANVMGVEPSTSFVKSLENSSIPYYSGNFEDIDRSCSYDLIVMIHVLEHFYDPNAALQKAFSLLSSDGLFVIEVPNILKPFRSLDTYFLRYGHLINYSPATLISMLGKHGFQCVFMDTGSENWRTPQNLFIIARKIDTLSQDLPKQKWTDVVDVLRNYRNQWQRWGRFRYFFYLFVGDSKRKTIRLLRPVVRKLRGNKQQSRTRR